MQLPRSGAAETDGWIHASPRDGKEGRKEGNSRHREGDIKKEKRRKDRGSMGGKKGRQGAKEGDDIPLGV